MNWAWNAIEISVNMIEVGLAIFLINSKFHPRFKNIIPTLLAVAIGTAVMSYIAFYQITFMPDYMFMLSIQLAYVFIARVGNIWLKIFWPIITTVLICATAVIGISVGLMLPGVTMDVILREHSVTRFQLLVFCKLMQAIIFFLLAARKGSERLVSRTIIILLIVVPTSSFLTIFLLLEYGLGPEPSATSQFLMVGASMSILVSNLMVFILYESLSKQAERNLQMQTRLQQNDMLLRHNEEIAGLYEEMRSWRHDYHNHLQVIHGYVQLEKYDRLAEYLEEMEKNMAGMQKQINSGNLLIDAIVSVKMLLARNQNIDVRVDIQVPPSINIEDTDLSVLLGNLLDNAIEACQRIENPKEKPFIEIQIRSIKGQLHIMVKNSTTGYLKMSGNFFISNKSGKHHGIGLRRIDEITTKYGGYVSRMHENSVFETNIMLPLEKVLLPV